MADALPIYLDYNATTPIAAAVRDAMLEWLSDRWGNPSSAHAYGHHAAQAVATAREQVAALVGAQADEILFTSGVPLTMAGLESTSMMQLDEERQKRLFAAGTPLTDALAALTNIWGNKIPVLFDPVAVAYALGHRFSDTEQAYITVESDGLTKISQGTANATVLVKPRKDAFLDWYVGTVGGAGRL